MRSFLRAENECLTVGSVQINVLEVRHDSVKLGILDPNASPSYREEILYSRADDGDDDAESIFEPIDFHGADPIAMRVH